MKITFVKKHPYLASILIALLCTFLTASGMAIPQIMKLEMNTTYIIATIALVVSVMIGIYIMKRTSLTLQEYGFRLSENKSNRKVWWYIPLIMVEIVPIVVGGFSNKISFVQYIILVFFTIAVGFNEEIYFRGLVFQFLMVKGRKKAIIVSSIIFGSLHLINVLRGKSPLYLVLQMLFAFLVGIILAEIASITKSLWGIIIWHAAHDFIASITTETLDYTALIVLAIQVVILLIYAVDIWNSKINN